MNTALIVLAAIAVVVGFVAFKAAQDAMERNSRRGDWAIFLVRWLTGGHWTGRPQTNAGWKRKGTKALTQTGFAPRFYFWPRWKRAAFRTILTLGPFPVIYGLAVNQKLTITLVNGSIVLATLWLLWKVFKAVRKRRHRIDWVQPLHERIAPLADVPLSASPNSWLDVSKDRTEATLHLPASFRDTEPARDRLALRAAEALGMEEPEIAWSFAGKEPTLILRSSPAPPKFVSLTDIMSAIRGAKPDQLILGLGKRSAPIDISLHEDSPHVGASMGAGAGKSTLARFIAAQALHKGHIVLFLDIKRISHTWARGLPNVLYADTPELIHDALLWLGAELDRRNEVALANSDVEGEVNAEVGARLIIIAEELNLTANRLRSYWLDNLGGKGVSPALTAFQDVAFAGRQVKMNIFAIGQMLTARVTGGTSGGNEARENIGVRMLARYTKKNWDMLVPEHAMPIVSGILGRVQVIASGKVRECQVAYLKGIEARDLALNGVISALPADVPKALLTTQYRPGIAVAQQDQEVINSQSELGNGTEPITENIDSGSANGPVMPAISLSEAIDQKLFPDMTLNMLRHARRRDITFPAPVRLDTKTNAHLYDLGQLAEWYQMRSKKK